MSGLAVLAGGVKHLAAKLAVHHAALCRSSCFRAVPTRRRAATIAALTLPARTRAQPGACPALPRFHATAAPMGRSKGFYAVRVGRQPGIYGSWAECQPLVHGYPGAVFKSFVSRQEAEAYMGSSSSPAARVAAHASATTRQAQQQQQQQQQQQAAAPDPPAGCYAVRQGRQTGIFDSWTDCQAAVQGHPNAEFRKHPTHAAAAQWLASAAATGHTTTAAAGGAVGRGGRASSPEPKRQRLLAPANNASGGALPQGSHDTPAVQQQHQHQHQQPQPGEPCAQPAAAAAVAAAEAAAPPHAPSAIPASGRVLLMFDGGSRGNGAAAGSAGYGYVLFGDAHQVLWQGCGTFTSSATNNVAEYTGLLRGLQRALAMGARHVDIQGDSQLVIHQVNGRWQVKHPDMRALHGQVMEVLGRFSSWSADHVRRELNKDADALSNLGMDLDVAIRQVGRLYGAMDRQLRSGGGSGSGGGGGDGAALLLGSAEEEEVDGVLRLAEVDRGLVVKRLLARLQVGSGVYEQLMAAPDLLPAAAAVLAKLWDDAPVQAVREYMQERGWLDYEPWAQQQQE